MGDDQNHEQGCPHCNHCRRKLIVKRWRDGETQMDIAAALGVTQSKVSRELRLAGMTRTRSEARRLARESP